MDERRRYREIEFEFEGETRMIERSDDLLESSVGFYLYDYSQQQVYALEDGWHFDIEVDGKGFTYFSTFFPPARSDLFTDYPECVKINYKPFSVDNCSLQDGDVIIFDLDGVEEFFIFTTDKELSAVEAETILQTRYHEALSLSLTTTCQQLPQEIQMILNKCHLVQESDFSVEQLVTMIDDINSMEKEIKKLLDAKMA